MPVERDPEALEPKYLHNFADFANAHVLEIGCGDGRLTWRYASSARYVIATDPDPVRLAAAQNDRPPELSHSPAFAQVEAQHLPFSDETFDLTIFAWSL
jgi:ubiquinone/menaquinone biosynthesis C-methylase UbiE